MVSYRATLESVQCNGKTIVMLYFVLSFAVLPLLKRWGVVLLHGRQQDKIHPRHTILATLHIPSISSHNVTTLSLSSLNLIPSLNHKKFKIPTSHLNTHTHFSHLHINHFTSPQTSSSHLHANILTSQQHKHYSHFITSLLLTSRTHIILTSSHTFSSNQFFHHTILLTLQSPCTPYIKKE